MEYIEFAFKISPLEPWKDILEAELGEVGFESFIDSEDGLMAYVQEELFDEESFEQISTLNNSLCEISYQKNKVIPQNWNEEWEKNFSPINVNDKCVIRAPFHDKTDVDYEIIIEPKMSFGTGHHETTHMMVEYLLEMDLKDKEVMDMGCGTGILAILAKLKNSASTYAVDIDQWAYENTIENCERNSVAEINTILGDASVLTNDMSFDVFIANINRNILINDMEKYSETIKKDGILLLSGFYTADVEILLNECAKYGFELLEQKERNNWAALKLKKN